MLLEGKKAVVTGGTRGIGFAVVETFLKNGASVALFGSRQETVDKALAKAGVAADAIDRVFLTGGSSLIPAVRGLFDRRFGTERIASGGELTSIAHGLAMIGALAEPELWAA